MKRPTTLILASTIVLCACGGAGSSYSYLAASASSAPQAKVITSAPAWELDWSDEFDGATLDHGKWKEQTGGDGWGNDELENYTRRPENIRLENGMLVIEARKEAFGGNRYTSARISSAGLKERTYGRYEARIKLPKGQGIWPAFWLLGSDIGTAGWPACGEIDIMENIGKEPATVYGTLHGPGYSGSNGFQNHVTLENGNFYDAFHVYALEWEPNEIRWYIDGKQYHTAKPELVHGAWKFDHPFNVILNLAVGGGWPGNPDANTSFPQQMLVDYVRVYRRAGQRG